MAKRRGAPLSPDDPRHGTDNGYNNFGCRCQDCRDAWAATCRKQQANRVGLPFDQKPHGTRNGYFNYGCRCDDCMAAMGYGESMDEKSNRRADRVEEYRQLAPDHTIHEIMELMGLSRSSVYDLGREAGVRPRSPFRSPDEPTLEFLFLRPGLDFDTRAALVRATRAQGFTLEAIGRRLGVTREMVRLIQIGKRGV